MTTSQILLTSSTEEDEPNELHVCDLKPNTKSNPSVQPKLSHSLLAMLKNPRNEVAYESKISLATQICHLIREENDFIDNLERGSKGFTIHTLKLGMIQKSAFMVL